jgi:hypothetical protein
VRLFAAFAILPFVAGVLAYFGSPLFVRSLDNQTGGSSSGFEPGFALATAFVALVVTVLGAVPLLSKMQSRGPITFKQCLLAGIALGNAPFFIVCLLMVIVHLFVGSPIDTSRMWYGTTGAIRTITTSTLMGAALGSVFWVVGIRKS